MYQRSHKLKRKKAFLKGVVCKLDVEICRTSVGRRVGEKKQGVFARQVNWYGLWQGEQRWEGWPVEGEQVAKAQKGPICGRF